MNAINSTLSLRRARYFCTGKSWKLLHWQKYTLHKIFVVIFSASLEFTFDTTPLHRYHILVFYPRHLQGCKIFRLHSRYKILSLFQYRYGWETGYGFFLLCSAEFAIPLCWIKLLLKCSVNLFS